MSFKGDIEDSFIAADVFQETVQRNRGNNASEKKTP